MFTQSNQHIICIYIMWWVQKAVDALSQVISITTGEHWIAPLRLKSFRSLSLPYWLEVLEIHHNSVSTVFTRKLWLSLACRRWHNGISFLCPGDRMMSTVWAPVRPASPFTHLGSTDKPGRWGRRCVPSLGRWSPLGWARTLVWKSV